MKLKTILLLFIIVLFSTSCQNNIAENYSDSQYTPIPLDAELDAETQTPVLKETLTNTSIGLENTKTATIISESTDTPNYCDLEKVEGDVQWILNSFKSNFGCDFPCIGGITPGVTTKQEVEEFFSEIDTCESSEYEILKSNRTNVGGFKIRKIQDSPEEHEVAGIYYYNFDENGKIGSVEFGYSISMYEPEPQFSDEEIIKETIFTYLEKYSLNGVLNHYGNPDEIYVSVLVNVDTDYVELVKYAEFNITFYYEKLNTVFQFYDSADIVDETILVCFQENTINISSWDKTRFPDLTTIRVYMSSIPNNYSEQNLYLFERNSFEEAFSMTVEEFVRLYSDPDYQECLVTPLEIWEW